MILFKVCTDFSAAGSTPTEHVYNIASTLGAYFMFHENSK